MYTVRDHISWQFFGAAFFLAKTMARAKQKPVQKVFKMKPFKVKRVSLKAPKLPRITSRKIKV